MSDAVRSSPPDAGSGVGILPDGGGRIAGIAIALSPDMLSEKEQRVAMRAPLGAFAQSLAEDVVLHLVTEAGSEAAAESWIARLGLACSTEIVASAPTRTMSPMSLWVQDSFLVCGNGTSYAWTVSENPARHAEWLATATGAAVARHGLFLPGGNVLAGPDFALIGQDCVDHTAGMLRGEGETAGPLDRIAALLGVRPTVVAVPDRRTPGRMRQPDFHIDRVISPTGKRDASGRPVLLVARIVSERQTGWSGGNDAGRTLDAVAELLDAEGFSVIRNPAALRPLPGTIDWRLRASNNVQLEGPPAAGGSGTVWLPCFANIEPEMHRTDDENAAIWSGLGFTVVRVPGWTALAGFSGALRCATKIVKRR